MGSYVKRAIIINRPQRAPLEAAPECEGSAVSPTLASSAFGLPSFDQAGPSRPVRKVTPCNQGFSLRMANSFLDPLKLNQYFYLNLVSAIFGGKASLELNKFNFKLRP
jgi:hypothetical protein